MSKLVEGGGEVRWTPERGRRRRVYNNVRDTGCFGLLSE